MANSWRTLNDIHIQHSKGRIKTFSTALRVSLECTHTLRWKISAAVHCSRRKISPWHKSVFLYDFFVESYYKIEVLKICHKKKFSKRIFLNSCPHHPLPTRTAWNYSMAHHKEISGGTAEEINSKIMKKIQRISYLTLWGEPKEKNVWMQMIILLSLSKVLHSDQYCNVIFFFFFLFLL